MAEGNLSENGPVTRALKEEWQERSFNDRLSTSTQRLIHYCNNFEKHVRSQFAELDAKLMSLEREMDYLEQRYSTVQPENRIKDDQALLISDENIGNNDPPSTIE